MIKKASVGMRAMFRSYPCILGTRIACDCCALRLIYWTQDFLSSPIIWLQSLLRFYLYRSTWVVAVPIIPGKPTQHHVEAPNDHQAPCTIRAQYDLIYKMPAIENEVEPTSHPSIPLHHHIDQSHSQLLSTKLDVMVMMDLGVRDCIVVRAIISVGRPRSWTQMSSPVRVGDEY